MEKPFLVLMALRIVEASVIYCPRSRRNRKPRAGLRYHLVKLLEKFGQVEQFDFLFHKSGPLEGQPRGYCFVNFHTKEVPLTCLIQKCPCLMLLLEAERAIQCLNGKLALSKKLVVRWAHAQRFEPYRGDKNLPASLEPSCSEAEEQPTSLSVSAKIKAIEAKLQMMEDNVDEEYSGPSPYLYNKPPEKKDKRSQPYNKQFRRFKR
ncbi:probable RNA-binding protein 18 isoform X2 [Ictalurus furcatus]|uniref:probable RNA-binding protein 18 isoform X2 n=1 Tax=Ictalurus furcatus TaxID=66913 RepID=UPI00234FBE1F|nr:probable RNA-binding protein 18 isoform X2 [Ictalurus furcatus]XP_053501171.1 probable RNA-binding protein 18 isoform X2 [Ictalurus furcatus]